MNQYRKCVERIHVSESLNARVLETVRATRDSRKKTYDRCFRIAAGAACALALVLGTISLRETVKPVLEYPGSTTEEPFKPLLDYSFGITAGAVEHAVNGGLIFRWEDGHGSFRISGEHIREVYLETSRGILLKGEERLGTSIREPFSAHTVYGLAAPEGEEITDIGQVELLLEVAFEDGTVKEDRKSVV